MCRRFFGGSRRDHKTLSKPSCFLSVHGWNPESSDFLVYDYDPSLTEDPSYFSNIRTLPVYFVRSTKVTHI